MSGSSVISGATFKSSPDTSLTSPGGSVDTGPPKLPRPRVLNPSSVHRPSEAPPAPPPRRPTSHRPISFILGPKAQESGLSPDLDNADTMMNLQETYMSSFFQTEPLYQQFYTNQQLIQASEASGPEEMYECIKEPLEPEHVVKVSDQEEDSDKIAIKSSKRPSAMDLTVTGGRRSMWSELPEVVNSGILNNISPEAKQLHEAMFEIVTSEASYLKSLNVLMKHFAQDPKLSGVGEDSVISRWDHKRLFGDVINVRQCSERFLEDLEKMWQASVLLDGLCEVVRNHAKNHFGVYVKYCSNQVDQGKLLKELR